MCDCGASLKCLQNETFRFKYEYDNDILNKTYDYVFCTCRKCNVPKEYFNDNFVFCAQCEKCICDKCDDELVYNIYNYKFCSCDNNNYIRYYDCAIHKYYYCDMCKLHACYKCEKENDIMVLCPLCDNRHFYKNKFVCNLHNNIIETFK